MLLLFSAGIWYASSLDSEEDIEGRFIQVTD